MQKQKLDQFKKNEFEFIFFSILKVLNHLHRTLLFKMNTIDTNINFFFFLLLLKYNQSNFFSILP